MVISTYVHPWHQHHNQIDDIYVCVYKYIGWYMLYNICIYWNIYIHPKITPKLSSVPWCPIPGQPWSALCHCKLVIFSRTLYKWNPTAYTLFCLSSFTQHNSFEIYLHCCMSIHNSLLLYWCLFFHNLSIHLLMDIWVVSSFRLLQTKFPWTLK